jgi:hypothetical protein
MSEVAYVLCHLCCVYDVQVDGEENTHIQSVMFENFPINTAKFLIDGSELLLGSEYRTYLQSYDMISGRALHIPCPISGPEINSMSVSISKTSYMAISLSLSLSLSLLPLQKVRLMPLCSHCEFSLSRGRNVGGMVKI